LFERRLDGEDALRRAQFLEPEPEVLGVRLPLGGLRDRPGAPAMIDDAASLGH